MKARLRRAAPAPGRRPRDPGLRVWRPYTHPHRNLATPASRTWSHGETRPPRRRCGEEQGETPVSTRVSYTAERGVSLPPTTRGPTREDDVDAAEVRGYASQGQRHNLGPVGRLAAVAVDPHRVPGASPAALVPLAHRPGQPGRRGEPE